MTSPVLASNQYDFSDGATVAYYYVLVVIRPLFINIGVSFFKCILVLWGINWQVGRMPLDDKPSFRPLTSMTSVMVPQSPI